MKITKNELFIIKSLLQSANKNGFRDNQIPGLNAVEATGIGRSLLTKINLLISGEGNI